MFLLKDTTQWHRWGSNLRPFGLESSTLPLSHCAPTSWYLCTLKIQIILHINTVWSESLFYSWRNDGPLATHRAPIQDSDQMVRMCRLIWVFDACTPTCTLCWIAAHIKYFNSFAGMWWLLALCFARQRGGDLYEPWRKKKLDHGHQSSFFIA